MERPLIEDETNPLDNVTVFYERNKKVLTGVISAVVIIVGGYFIYTKFIKEPNNEKAAAAMAYPQLYFQADSLDMALNGAENHPGFIKIAKKYDGTPSANLAHYYEGICYLKKGDYKNSIKALESFDGKGTMLGYQAWGCLGEAYMEDKQTGKAIESFKKATGNKEDEVVTPTYLYQLGLAYVADNKPNDAKSAFLRIRDEYPRSMQARDMDKELARLGEVNEK